MSFSKSPSGRHVRKVITTTTAILAPDGSPVVPVSIETVTPLTGNSLQAVSPTISEGGPVTYIEVLAAGTLVNSLGIPTIPVEDVSGTLSTSAAAMAIGVNTDGNNYWQNSQMFTDIISGLDDNFIYYDSVSTTWKMLPRANIDSNGNPVSLPANGAYIRVDLEVPDTIQQYKVSWTDPTNDFILDTTAQMSGVSAITSHSFTFTPTVSQPAGLGPQLFYHIGSNGGHPTDLKCRPVVDDGSLLNPNWSTRLNLAGGPLRFYSCTTVFVNARYLAAYNVIKNPIDGDGQLVDPIYTSTKRNKSNWNLSQLDGMPLETIIAVATQLNCDIHWGAPYNCDSASTAGGNNANTYLTLAASLFAAFSAATGKKVYVTRANEVWNYGFMVACQNGNEAGLLGVTPEAHYALKCKEVFDTFATAFASAGVSSKLVRVLEWQNANTNMGVWANMLAVTSADYLCTAPYVGSNQSGTAALQAAFPLAYTGSMATYWALAKDDVDAQMVFYKGHSDYALAHGMKMMTYEGGPEIVFTSGAQTFLTLRDANYKDFTMYFFQEMEKVNSNAVVIPFINTQRSTNTDGSHIGNGYWGFREGTYQAPGVDTPKWNGMAAYIAGQRSPQTLLGTLSIATGSANGTLVGTLRRNVKGSTIAIQSGGAGLAVDSATGAVTVGSSGSLPAVGSSSVTFRETHAGFPAPGYLDTVLSLTVTSALLMDDFNTGGALDAAKWTTGIGLVNVGVAILTTGQTAAQTSGQFVISATATSHRGMSLISVADIDLTVSPSHFVKQVSSADAGTNQGMAFGVPGGKVLHINRSSDFVLAEIVDNTGSTTSYASGGSTRSIAAWPWSRIRYAGGNLHVDFAAPGASNPPIAGDWVLDVINTTWPVTVSTTGKIGVFYFNEFGVTAGNFVWDGFNTGT